MKKLFNYIEAFLFILIFGVGNVVKLIWDKSFSKIDKDLINRQLDIE